MRKAPYILGLDGLRPTAFCSPYDEGHSLGDVLAYRKLTVGVERCRRDHDEETEEVVILPRRGFLHPDYGQVAGDQFRLVGVVLCDVRDGAVADDCRDAVFGKGQDGIVPGLSGVLLLREGVAAVPEHRDRCEASLRRPEEFLHHEPDGEILRDVRTGRPFERGLAEFLKSFLLCGPDVIHLR